MAVDVCTEIWSPRISFSYDFKEFDFVPVENHGRRSDSFLLNPAVDFDHCRGLFPHEISPADELFADGKILPVQIRKLNTSPSCPFSAQIKTQPTPEPKPKPNKAPQIDAAARNETTAKKRLVEFLSNALDGDEDGEMEKPPPAKPFWQFRRSSSADSEGGRPTGLLRIRSLHFLVRSNSTGSVPNADPTGFSRSMRKQQSLKEESAERRSGSPVSSLNRFHHYYPYGNNNCNFNSNNNEGNATASLKGSMRKSWSRSGVNNNGIRFSPVLNIPPAYIGKGTVSLFGSFFCNKKSKKKR